MKRLSTLLLRRKCKLKLACDFAAKLQNLTTHFAGESGEGHFLIPLLVGMQKD
jgi:hypothetical protein